MKHGKAEHLKGLADSTVFTWNTGHLEGPPLAVFRPTLGVIDLKPRSAEIHETHWRDEIVGDEFSSTGFLGSHDSRQARIRPLFRPNCVSMIGGRIDYMQFRLGRGVYGAEPEPFEIGMA